MSTPEFFPSFSVLNKYAEGDHEGAIKAYFHFPDLDEEPEYITIGKAYHEKFAKIVESTQMLPTEFGTIALSAPRVEEVFYYQVDKHIHFKGIPDCFNNQFLVEFKIGKTPAADWASSMQIPCYSNLLAANGIYPNVGRIFRLNPETGVFDHALIFLSPDTRESAHQWISHWSHEMYDTLIQHDLFNQFNVLREIL